MTIDRQTLEEFREDLKQCQHQQETLIQDMMNCVCDYSCKVDVNITDIFTEKFIKYYNEQKRK